MSSTFSDGLSTKMKRQERMFYCCHSLDFLHTFYWAIYSILSNIFSLLFLVAPSTQLPHSVSNKRCLLFQLPLEIKEKIFSNISYGQISQLRSVPLTFYFVLYTF